MQDLIRDAGEECGAGAKQVALFVIVLCSVILDFGAEMVAVFVIVPCAAVIVVPVYRHRCVQIPCGEALGTVGGTEGLDTLVMVWLVLLVAEVVAGMVGWA